MANTRVNQTSADLRLKTNNRFVALKRTLHTASQWSVLAEKPTGGVNGGLVFEAGCRRGRLFLSLDKIYKNSRIDADCFAIGDCFYQIDSSFTALNFGNI